MQLFVAASYLQIFSWGKILPQLRTDYLKKSFSYSGAQLWNSLPIELRQANSLNEFKTKLKRHSYK